MAVMLAKSATTEAEVIVFYNSICETDFVALLIESVHGFSDGWLPGNLGDTPEAMDTGEGKPRLCGDSSACIKLADALMMSVRVCRVHPEGKRPANVRTYAEA